MESLGVFLALTFTAVIAFGLLALIFPKLFFWNSEKSRKKVLIQTLTGLGINFLLLIIVAILMPQKEQNENLINNKITSEIKQNKLASIKNTKNNYQSTNKQVKKIVQKLKNIDENKPKDFFIKVNQEVTSDKKIIISGETNLPIGTKIGIELENEKLSYYPQDFDVLINEHYKFKSSLFSYKGEKIPNGVYKYNVILYKNSNWQNEAILKALNNIKIKFISDNSIASGKIIIKNSFKEVNFETIAKEIYSTSKELINQGIYMSSIKSDLSKCGNIMRSLESKTDKLQKDAEKLPLAYINLKTITGNIGLCVHCSDGAIDYCKMAESDLKNLNKDYK